MLRILFNHCIEFLNDFLENGSVDRLLTTVVDTLTIKNADESDSGSYICNATNEAGSDTSQIRVKVTGKDVRFTEKCFFNTFTLI